MDGTNLCFDSSIRLFGCLSGAWWAIIGVVAEMKYFRSQITFLHLSINLLTFMRRTK